MLDEKRLQVIDRFKEAHKRQKRLAYLRDRLLLAVARDNGAPEYLCDEMEKLVNEHYRKADKC